MSFLCNVNLCFSCKKDRLTSEEMMRGLQKNKIFHEYYIAFERIKPSNNVWNKEGYGKIESCKHAKVFVTMK